MTFEQWFSKLAMARKPESVIEKFEKLLAVATAQELSEMTVKLQFLHRLGAYKQKAEENGVVAADESAGRKDGE